MKTWSNGAKNRLVEIRAAEDGEQDMRAIAASIAKLPPGQLKKSSLTTSLPFWRSTGW